MSHSSATGDRENAGVEPVRWLAAVSTTLGDHVNPHGWYQRALAADSVSFSMHVSRLWAPFAMVICAADASGFYQKLGWHVAEAPVWCEQSGRRQSLTAAIALTLPCQGDTAWPSGQIDLCGAPW
jgi:hypothetical protein